MNATTKLPQLLTVHPAIGLVMWNSIIFRLSCGSLINCLLLASLTAGQLRVQQSKTSANKADQAGLSTYLIDMSQQADAETVDVFQDEAARIAKVLSLPSRKSPVVIDDGAKRDLIIRSAARRLAETPSNKHLVKIDWSTLFSNTKTERETAQIVSGILKLAESSKGKLVLYIEDIGGLSNERPMFGDAVAADLNNSIADGVFHRSFRRRPLRTMISR